jgi:hypothetical protein
VEFIQGEAPMIKTLAVLGVLGLTAPVGEVFGDIRVGDEYVKEAAVELKCGEEVVKGKTDANGSYRLTAKASGKCTISVTHDGQTAKVDVVLFDKAARYRLVLEKKDDTWTLRRV